MSTFWNSDLQKAFPMTEETSGGSYPKRTFSFPTPPVTIVTEMFLSDTEDGPLRHYKVDEGGSFEEQHLCRPPNDIGAFWSTAEEFWECPDCQQKHYPHADFWWQTDE